LPIAGFEDAPDLATGAFFATTFTGVFASAFISAFVVFFRQLLFPSAHFPVNSPSFFYQ
jgi:hypothetical protein